jgi:hypothetical protein
MLAELYKRKDLPYAAFSIEEVHTYAAEMLAAIMKHDVQKAEGYKQVLLLCLKVLESRQEGGVKEITSIIKPVAPAPTIV